MDSIWFGLMTKTKILIVSGKEIVDMLFPEYENEDKIKMVCYIDDMKKIVLEIFFMPSQWINALMYVMTFQTNTKNTEE